MRNLFDIKDKVALITGASSGLGAGFAKLLAEQGAKVAIGARRVEKLENLKKEIEENNGECFSIQLDVTDPKNCETAVNEVVNHFGTIDILINCAGIANAAPCEMQNYEDWDKIVKTNLYGTYNMCHEVGKIMKEKKYGKIINLGSIHSMVAMPGLPLNGYCATKGAVLMLTKELANEWAKDNITVNAIGPAYFESEMTHDLLENPEFSKGIEKLCPMGRAGRQGELDGAILYFASDASSYTTGAYLPIDGGWTAV